MKPTFKALARRIAEYEKIYGSNDYHLICKSCGGEIIYLVDVSAPSTMALFTHNDVKYLCKGFMGYFCFEVIWLNASEAKECGCEEGDYLCISFIVK